MEITVVPTLSKPRSEEELEIKFEIQKAKIAELVPHEGILDWHLKEIFEWMQRDGFQLRPIAVSRLDSLGPKWKGRLLIHDGHHRTAALKKLDCTKIMVSIFDFNNPRIKVYDYNDITKVVTKDEVIKRATSGIEVTPRYDKHYIEVDGRLEPFHDNDLLEPQMPTPFSELK
jgi:hypothetical protein